MEVYGTPGIHSLSIYFRIRAVGDAVSSLKTLFKKGIFRFYFFPLFLSGNDCFQWCDQGSVKLQILDLYDMLFLCQREWMSHVTKTIYRCKSIDRFTMAWNQVTYAWLRTTATVFRVLVMDRLTSTLLWEHVGLWSTSPQTEWNPFTATKSLIIPPTARSSISSAPTYANQRSLVLVSNT